MMATLWNKSKNVRLVENLHVASNPWSRMRGLLGRSSLPTQEAMLFKRSNSIHTFFMKFSIDVVFVNRNFVVKKIFRDVRPGRLVLPVWTASHVIEFAAGSIRADQLSVGDQLHVDC